MYTEKEILEKLTMVQLRDEISNTDKNHTKLKKEDLITMLQTEMNGNEMRLQNLIRKYPDIFSITPAKLEEFLNITKAERKRWTNEGKLSVSYYESFHKWGKTHVYPMYNLYQVNKLTQESINLWRENYKEHIAKSRKKATKKAVQTRNQNKAITREFYEKEWKSLLKKWYKDNALIGATLQLAYWTMWVNRYAKEMQIKQLNAKSKSEEYKLKKETFYAYKNVALKLLFTSPLTTVSFYRPLHADKISNLFFCDHHFELWMLEREYEYITKWDFFYSHQKDIYKCKNCNYNPIKDYYSLYFISVEIESVYFSFHIPFPLGSDFLPSPNKIVAIQHEEQEGLFRFGRALLEEEKIIFKEKSIIKYFEEAILKYKHVYTECSSIIDLPPPTI
ncbi:hypothetical protein [Bacillus cereus group sp. BfR-BA-01380]|uniref:hypothetical protein n=1 Tax=Bacillus cereus group sp. BfR-BA-01380 TaxID=2920324 RepID=UPI001F5718F4|nr:hypothetical protein [Bacillus cereus group sp. BfR-BA-01380]